MDIRELKTKEMVEIQDFCYQVEEYGHIFHLDHKLLDEPFDKIMDGIKKIRRLMRESGEKNLKH